LTLYVRSEFEQANLKLVFDYQTHRNSKLGLLEFVIWCCKLKIIPKPGQHDSCKREIKSNSSNLIWTSDLGVTCKGMGKTPRALPTVLYCHDFHWGCWICKEWTNCDEVEQAAWYLIDNCAHKKASREMGLYIHIGDHK